MRLFFGFLILLSIPVSAEEKDKDGLDQHSRQALQQTMQLLRSPDQRGAEISKNKDAKKADDYAKSVAMTPENTQRLYELAALIMENLVKQTQGDPDKMVKLLEQAQKNPAAFASTFTPEQKKMLKALSEDIEKAQKTSKATP